MPDGTIAGLGGAARNLAVAIVRGGQLHIACEQERFTRARAAGFSPAQTPEFVRDLLRLIEGADAPDAYATAEASLAVDTEGARHHQLAHAYAHACASFLTSPFESAAIVVCDTSSAPEVTVWRGAGSTVSSVEMPWKGEGFAKAYSRLTAAFGMTPRRDEHRFEALARVGAARAPAVPALMTLAEDHLEFEPDWQATAGSLIAAAGPGGTVRSAGAAHALQRQLADLTAAFAARVRETTGEENVCLAGGLFYNSSINTAVADASGFRRCFVPPHPGNPGLAIGAALAAAGDSLDRQQAASTVYLGPEYDDGHIKRLLDNCKLTYDYAGEGTLLGTVADAIARGRLVGWFQGAMEWGPRALGHRSILANPVSPHVLANLNTHLKQGNEYRTYGIMLPERDAAAWLRDPRPSRFMELESAFVEPERFRALLPHGTERVRYQTVPASETRLTALLDAVATRTGCPIVVNTSFNGFHEPIACAPRDAIRIFYGTGLDLLAIGNFLVRK